MTIRQNSLEGGANGVTIDVGNSGGASGDAFDQRTGSAAFSTVRAAHGSVSAYFSGSGSTRYLRYTMAASVVLARAYVYYPTLVTGQSPIRINGDSGGPVYVVLHSSGGLQLIHSTGLATAPSVFPTGQWVRVELYAKSGAGDGEVRCAYYLGDSTTPVWDSGAFTGRTFAGNLYANYGSSDNTTGEVWLDSIGAKSATDATWGAWAYTAPNAAPVLTLAPSSTVAAGNTASVSVSATDDGSIAFYAWTVVAGSSSTTPTLTGASTATVSFPTTGLAGNLVTLQIVVTDNLGLTSTATTEVRIPVAGDSTTLPLDGIGDTGWTIIGGSSSQGAALGDGSTSTRVESPDMTSTVTKRRWRLKPMASRSGLAITLSAVALTGAITHNSKMRVFSGTTQITQRTLAATTSDSSPVFALTSGELAAIADWGNVWVEVEAVL